MKKLMVVACAAMLGAAVSAGTVPRVFQYTANLNTPVAKNAAKVTFTIDGEKYTVENVCYRVKGKVTFKGAIIFGCDCMPFDDLEEGYPLVLMTSSEDKYKTLYVYESDSSSAFELMIYNRMGSPLSSKATVADIYFTTVWYTGLGDACYRFWYLGHAGFGKTAVIDKGDGTMDLSTLAGNVTGYGMAPFCSAQDNSCPRCLEDDECEYAIAFQPCDYEDPFSYETSMPMVSAFGTFSLKFNKTYSSAIKDIPEDDLEGTVEALILKAFKQIKSEDQVWWVSSGP